jgi:hypothetical protein
MAGVADIVQGKNCLFQVNFGDGYQSVVCAKGFTVTFDTELKETTSRGSGVHKEYDYKSLSGSINLTGLIKVADNDGNAIFFDLAFYQKNFIEVPFKALFEDNFGVIKSIRGLGIIRSSAFTASAAQLADSSVDIQISGEYHIESDTALGCSNTITQILIDGSPHTPGASLILVGAGTNINLGINTLANPALEIFRYDYEVNSSGRNSAWSSGALPFDIGEVVIPMGASTLTIYPVCDNGFDGTPYILSITKGETPPI